MDVANAAINSVRAQAVSIRNTLAIYLEGELRNNANPNWPELLNSFQVIARQLVDMTNDVDEVLDYFVFEPRRPTANTGHIPLFLSTRPLAEMDAARGAAMKAAAARQDDYGEITEDSIRKYNSEVEHVSNAYMSACEDLNKIFAANARVLAPKPPTAEKDSKMEVV